LEFLNELEVLEVYPPGSRILEYAKLPPEPVSGNFAVGNSQPNKLSGVVFV